MTPESPENQSWRFADGRIMPDGESIVCIREVHYHIDDETVLEPDNQIVSIPTDGSLEIKELVVGADFYALSSPFTRWRISCVGPMASSINAMVRN